MTVGEWLQTAERQLRTADISSPRLDAQLLLADNLKKEKAWLLAHPEAVVPEATLLNVDSQLKRRLNRKPMAYIRGKQAFYGRDFTVNKHVLIPRPETEEMITMLEKTPIEQGDVLVDVGTGSGCIAITAKLQCPSLAVYGLDVSQAALSVAAENAYQLNANVTFLQANLLQATQLPKHAHIIVANLPYVSADWQVSPETRYEPQQALFADSNGLALIFELCEQAVSHLNERGLLLLEADPRQHYEIIQKALSFGFTCLQHEGFILKFQKP